MNCKPWLSGVSVLFVLAMLAACGGGGGASSSAAPSSNSSTPPPDNVAGFAYVAGSSGVSAYTIDATTGALSEVAGSPVTAGDNPRTVTVHPSGKFAYVANFGTAYVSGNVSAYSINATTGALSEVAGSPYAAGTRPWPITLDPSGKHAYVANWGSGNVSVYTINGSTGTLSEVAGSPFLAGDSPGSAVRVDPSGKFAYVANHASGNVSAYTIDASTGALSEVAGSPISARDGPNTVTVDPSGKFAYVANNFSSNVSAYLINATTGALSEVTGSPYATTEFPLPVTIDPSGKFAYVVSGGNLSVTTISAYTINATTGALTSVGVPVTAEWGSQALIVEPSGRFAYAPSALDGIPGPVQVQPNGQVSAYAINTTTGSLTRLGAGVVSGIAPQSIAVDLSGKFAYVANGGSGDVSAYTINAETGALSEVPGSPFAAGTGPASVTATRKIR